MAEIEIGNMNKQCLDRRIAHKELLIDELAHWKKQRNKEKASIKWMFNLESSREKLSKSYAKLTGQN